MLVKSSLTVDTEIHLITLESLIVAMFLQANVGQQCILSWHLKNEHWNIFFIQTVFAMRFSQAHEL